MTYKFNKKSKIVLSYILCLTLFVGTSVKPFYFDNCVFAKVKNDATTLKIDSKSLSKLVENEFLVSNENEFSDFPSYYMDNTANGIPNFISSDSVLNTFMICIKSMIKSIESEKVYNEIFELTGNLLARSMDIYNLAKGTVFENEARRIVAYFSIPLKIMIPDYKIEKYVEGIVNDEIQLIEDCNEKSAIKPIFSDLFEKYKSNKDIDINLYFVDDYTKYKPYGHYNENETFKKYYKVLTWYTHTGFTNKILEMNMDALIICKSLDNTLLMIKYENIYDILTFCYGTSNDNTYNDYLPLIEKIYGEIDGREFYKDDVKLLTFDNDLKSFVSNRIKSNPITYNLNNNVCFRLIGNFENSSHNIFEYITNNVKPKENGETRYLPDFLDIPAAFNSQIACQQMIGYGKTDYPLYTETLADLQKDLNTKLSIGNAFNINDEWLKILKILVEDETDLNKKPSFMKNKLWLVKTLETIAGSFVELNCDNSYNKFDKGLLISTSSNVNLNDSISLDNVIIDEKGYVEPREKLYGKLRDFTHEIKENLGSLNSLSNEYIDKLSELEKLFNTLSGISNKEINNKDLNLEEISLIKNYGSIIKNITTELDDCISEKKINSIVKSKPFYTGTYGSVKKHLELGNGSPVRMYVIVNDEGLLKVYFGAAYNFYQYETNNEDILYDEEFANKLYSERKMPKPFWCISYRK